MNRRPAGSRGLGIVMGLALGLGLGGCETPPMKIVYEVANGTSQSCGSSKCADVKLPCDAVISIRIIDPDDPTAPYLSLCEPVPPNRNRDLCAISSIELADMPVELPKRTLDVQILIWPRAEVEDPVTGELDCRKHDVKFDGVAGFPISQQPSPAIGGHAYYHPGDALTTVTLGCTDLVALNTCGIDTRIEVSATVENFENLNTPVSINEASRFSVDVGEPKFDTVENVHTLNPGETRKLDLTVVGIVPIWRANVDLRFTSLACVQVLENSAQATAALSCIADVAPPTTSFTVPSIQFPKATLDQVLAALQLPQFPANGLTVGIVVDDDLYNPVAGETVNLGMGTVRYLSADRSTTIPGTQTSASGMFVSLDAPFGTGFSVDGGREVIGGQVQGRVTVVVIKVP
ncbi:MAG: hypothetical protein M3680_33730 [Myxococcota bacterium]|nr:hypothetical protein [Myxococcota bacterium]